MPYREKLIKAEEYNRLLDYYERLLFNNNVFFMGFYQRMAETEMGFIIQKIERKEFQKLNIHDIVPIHLFNNLDEEISKLEAEEYKINKIETEVLNRFLIPSIEMQTNSANKSKMENSSEPQTPSKTNKLKSMILGIVLIISEKISNLGKRG